MAKIVTATTESKFVFDGTDYFLTNMTYEEAYTEVDVTDTNTTGDGKEFLGGRAERTFTVDVIQDVTAADITANSKKVITCSFENKTYVGSGSILGKTVVGAIDDAVKNTYSGKFAGEVTITVAS